METTRKYVNPELKRYVNELLESEDQLATDLATERQRNGILTVACVLLFLLSMILLVVLFA